MRIDRYFATYAPIVWLITAAPSAEAAARTALQDTVRLSLPQAVARALSESEEVAVARAQLAQSEAQVTQARSAALPNLNTALTYNRAIRTVFDAVAAPEPADETRIPNAFDTSRTPQERYDILSELMVQDMMSNLFRGLPFGRRNTYVALFQLRQPLFTGGRILSGIDLARHALTATELAVEETEAELVLRVQTAYLNAVLTQRLFDIAVESRRVAEEHLRQVEAFHRSGTASDFDLLRAQVDFENRDPPVIQSLHTAELAMLELKRLVNIPTGLAVELTTDWVPPDVQVDEAELRRLVASRPAREAARQTVEMREAGVRLAKAQRWPTLQVSGNLGFQAYPSTVTPPGFDAWLSDWTIVLGISWTPFDGFQTSGRVAEAKAQLRRARLEEQQLDETLAVDVEAALGEYRTAYAQVRARRETVTMAERTHRLAEVRFASGLSTQLEVSDAALLLDEARLNEVRAIHDYVRALATLERLSGGKLRLLTDTES